MAIMNHAITRNCASAIQSLYPQLNDYPKSVLSEMFLRRPLQIVDKAEGTLQFQEIVRLGSYDVICSAMVDRVFRKLTNNSRSTQALIKKILANTGTIIDKKVMDESMLYIEMRQLIVHNSGLMDSRTEKLHEVGSAAWTSKVRTFLATPDSEEATNLSISIWGKEQCYQLARERQRMESVL